MQKAQKAWGTISMRVGVDVRKRVEAESFAPFALQESNDNDTSMVLICHYLSVLHEAMGGRRGQKSNPPPERCNSHGLTR